MRLLLLRLVVALGACAAGACSRCRAAAARLHAARRRLLPADSEVIPGRVTASTTLAGLLSPQHLHDADIGGIVAAVSRVFDLRRLRAGQPWRFERTHDGCVRFLEYEIDAEHFLRTTARVGEPHAFDAAIIRYDVRQAGRGCRGRDRRRQPIAVCRDGIRRRDGGAADGARGKPVVPCRASNSASASPIPALAPTITTTF